jgi:hypothetical protein
LRVFGSISRRELKQAEHLEDDHDNDNDSDDVEDVFVHGTVVNTPQSPTASNMVPKMKVIEEVR